MSEELTKNLSGDGTEQIVSLLCIVDARLTGLDERVDRRLMETRPIWEQVLVRMEGVETRLGAVETRLGAVEIRFDGVDTRLGEIETRLRAVEIRFDGVDTRLGEVETRLGAVEIRFDGVDTRFDGSNQRIDNLALDTRAGFKRLERQMGQIAADYVAVRTDQSDLERRTDRLEDKLETKPVGWRPSVQLANLSLL